MAQQVVYRVFMADGTEDLEAKLNEAAGAGFRLAQAVHQGGTGVLYVVVEGPAPAVAIDPPEAD